MLRSFALGRRARGALSGLLLVAASGCVVTTYEGLGEPPNAPSRPPPVGVVEPSPSPGAPSDEPGRTPTDEPRTIAASHLVVMHRGSLRAPPGIQRGREAARQRAEEALARARAGEDFAKLVAEYSDEPGAALREGRLGRFTRQDMIEAFSDAAFQLDVGELSDVVETPFGYHVILRTE